MHKCAEQIEVFGDWPFKCMNISQSHSRSNSSLRPRCVSCINILGVEDVIQNSKS